MTFLSCLIVRLQYTGFGAKGKQESCKFFLGALPHHSARADRPENLCRKKAQNRRNTLCIARFCNAFVGQIGRQDVCGELCGDALNKCRGGTPLKKELLRLGIFMGVGFAARLLASCVRRAFCSSRARGVRTGPKLREGWTEKRARTPCAASYSSRQA